ncbi:MAG: hypothetical protein ABIN01_14735, partial [Ferruginibacter sp.]
MKNLFIKKLIFLFFISLNAIAQDGKFSFTLPSTLSTSAGVFLNDSILVRTLWNNEKYAAGTYTKFWDGKDDYGNAISLPASAYQIKVLSNNVQYAWQGTVGNTSDGMTGATKHRGYYYCMRGLAFSGNTGYFCMGYSEGSPSFAKFNIASPNTKLDITTSTVISGDINYVATDGTNVYWGAFDSYSTNNSFVFGTKVSDDSEVAFTTGTPYSVTYGKTYTKTISYLSQVNSLISGLAVQKAGNYLFVARKNINQLQVVNKTTGATVQTLSYTSARALSVDGSDNLWMVTGINTVAKYTVNSDGTLTTPSLTLSGLLDPLATQVSTDGTKISVADGGTSQQVKFFNNSTGAATSTYGTAGGYATDATVNNNKFYFNDLRSAKLPFIAFQSDGSYWVNDAGNSRVQHYSNTGTFINRVMSLGSTYSTWADRNNVNRAFAGYMEFAIDYSVQTLTGSTGWSLTKNWGANVTTAYDDFTLLKYQTTLSNGRTYAFIRKGSYYEVVELPATGTMRFTGIMVTLSKILCSDGSTQDFSEAGTTIIYKRFPLTGFDGSGNPQWSATAQTLASATSNNVIGSPADFPNSQIFSTTNKVVLFNPSIVINSTGPVYSTSYHLGLMEKGATNTYLFQTERSTPRNYQGEYPKAGYFEVGNGVNNFAGGNVNIVDRHIITSYHGEFWKNSQTNKYNHYYDNGLSIGQFGTTRPEVGFGNHAASMMAGNALSPVVVKDATGDLYLWHGDESDHAAMHRWKISGLNTIAEQVVTIPFPSAYIVPSVNYVDLMAGLPFDATLVNNTSGWTRSPLVDMTSNPSFKVHTSTQQFDKLTPNDLKVEYFSNTTNTSSVSRDLGTNNVTTNWKVTGSLSYPENAPNYGQIHQYFEILDNAGKVLTTFYPSQDFSTYPIVPTTINVNATTMATETGNTITNLMSNLVPFTISIVNGAVTFNYGNYLPVTTTISDPTGDWRKPAILRVRFVNLGNNYPGYPVTIDLYGLKFYKDYSATPVNNQSPISNAGTDKTITLPVNSSSLTGSGTDADGTISSYAWVKVSGPTSGTIATANGATTAISNLTQGVYYYELTVTDNNGATGKDTVQVTVNSAVNQAPTA